jgi:hypothetical protein
MLVVPTFVGFTFDLAAVTRWNHDGAKLRLNLGQLLDQFLWVRWHHGVQAVVLVLNLNGYVVHQEATHGKWGHRFIPAFDFRWAVVLILEAWETWSEVIELLHAFEERLDGQTMRLLECLIHVDGVTLGRVLVTHS